MIQGDIYVSRREGIHLRVATEIVRSALRFGSKVRIVHKGTSADAQSILSLLCICGLPGEILRITCEGADETEAFSAITHLLS